MKAGDALLALNRPDDALKAYRSALPDSASGFDEGIKMADRVAAAGQDQMAFTLYQDLAGTDPRRFEPHFRIAEILMRLGKLDEASAAMAYAGTLAPDNPLIPYQLTRIALAKQDEKAALAQIEKTIAMAPPELLPRIAADPIFASLAPNSPVRAALTKAGAPPAATPPKPAAAPGSNPASGQPPAPEVKPQ
jgi:tetratricopeptide (TPR) repeat protein